MITVVSLNPSIDRTLTLNEFHAGRTNRAQHARVDAGGKGINVCLHMKALGAQNVRCVGFMRQADEAMFTNVLQAAGVACEWLSMPGHVRTNTKICVLTGELTEINEAGEPVPETMVSALLERCRKLFAESDAVVLTGSVPPGVPKDIYAQLIQIAHEAGAACLLDADGDALKLGLGAAPDFIKPNRAELERLLNHELPDEAALLAAVSELQNSGVTCGCISLGEEGAMFFSDGRVLTLPALNVPVRSTVGAGDAMMAAFALGLAGGMGESEAFCLAVAASAAAVCTEGTQPADGFLTKQLLKYARSLLGEIGEAATISKSLGIVSRDGCRPLDEAEHRQQVQARIRQIFPSDER